MYIRTIKVINLHKRFWFFSEYKREQCIKEGDTHWCTAFIVQATGQYIGAALKLPFYSFLGFVAFSVDVNALMCDTENV